MKLDKLKADKNLRGPIFLKPVQVIVTVPMGDAVRPVAKDITSSRVYEPIIAPNKLPPPNPHSVDAVSLWKPVS